MDDGDDLKSVDESYAEMNQQRPPKRSMSSETIQTKGFTSPLKRIIVVTITYNWWEKFQTS